MIHCGKILGTALLAASFATAAKAGDWTNSASYNGYGTASQNTPSNYSMRDANGNLTMVNGQITPSTYSANSGAQSAASGAGASGAGAAYGQATAIGNSLNVVVAGTHNTTIVSSAQTNNGSQTAVTQLNTH